MNKVLAFTVIYPQAEKYKFDFIEFYALFMRFFVCFY